MHEPSQAAKALPIIGRYRVVAQLGSGGMAHVYLAVMRGDRGVNKLVVLKVPRDEVCSDPSTLAMFVDEARLAARLSHPNVVQTYEIVNEGDRDIIVMEYLDGYTLHELLAQANKLKVVFPLWMHLQVLASSLTGLQYAHEVKDFSGKPLQLVHRDISPHNIFITFDGQIKILDFGIAKAATSTHHTELGTFKGKVRYMPAEQLKGDDVDRRADIFATGACIWEAAVGERLWQGKNDLEVMTAIVGKDVPMPRDVSPNAPAALDAICRKAMAHDPADRYQTCLDLRADIERYLTTLADTGTSRDIVVLMESLFAENRAERQKLIDAQLARAEELSNNDFGALGAVAISTQSFAVPLLVTMTGSGSGRGGSSLGSGTGTPTAHITDLSTTSSTSPLLPVETNAAKKRRALSLAMVVCAAAVLVPALWLRASRRAGAAHDVPSTMAAKGDDLRGNAPPNVDSAPQKITVSVRAEPLNAKLFLDDQPVSGNPYIWNMPKDGSGHMVRAEAKGYTTKDFHVTADREKEVVMVLETVTAPTLPAAAARIAAPSSAKTPHVTSAAPAPEARAPEPPGYLSLDTYPWTRVSEGGKALGQTPLIRVPLAPGDHTLTLENPDQSLRQSYSVTIKSGEAMSRRLGLK